MEYINTYLDENGNVQPFDNPSWVVDETTQDVKEILIRAATETYINGLVTKINEIVREKNRNFEELEKQLNSLATRFEERTADLERRLQSLINILIRMNEQVVPTKNDVIE